MIHTAARAKPNTNTNQTEIQIMAYVNKEKKAKIVSAVKAVLPKGWKVTFAVRHYSTIVCTIRSAGVNLAHEFPDQVSDGKLDNLDVRNYHIRDVAKRNQNLSITLQNIMDALNTDNHDNSDAMTDYFDVGHYVDLRFGEWDKPFKDSRV